MNKKNKHEIDGMVDISNKQVTKRMAVASATIQLNREAYQILLNDQTPKGNVFETAKLAGIMAAKTTSAIIPMCHPLSLSKVKVTFERDEQNCQIITKAEVVCEGKTGVEMEALVAASTAALTIYDMMKFKDKGMVISNVQLESKSGGKNGDFIRGA